MLPYYRALPLPQCLPTRICLQHHNRYSNTRVSSPLFSRSWRSFSSAQITPPDLDLSSIKLITFDVTGTLLSFRKPPFEIYMDIGEKYGVKCERDAIKVSFKTQWKEMNKEQPHFGICWEDWWTEIVMRTFKGAGAQGADKSTLKKVASELIEHFKTIDCWMLKDGAKDILNAISTMPVFIGIISNFDPRLYEILRLFQLDNTFKPIILSHEHQTSKPSNKIFNIALESIRKTCSKEVKPYQALHVGDNFELDYKGAVNAGWKSCLITAEFGGNGTPQDAYVSNQLPLFFPDIQTFHEFLVNQGKNKI